MNIKQLTVAAGTALAAIFGASQAAEAGCVFNAKGKVVGIFGGDTKQEFDDAGRTTAKLTKGGFSVGMSQSRGVMVFYDSDDTAASKRNLTAAFPDGKREAFFRGCREEKWPKTGSTSTGESKVATTSGGTTIVHRRRETQETVETKGNGACIRKQCNYLMRLHGFDNN